MKIINAMITVATATTIELLCNSTQEGQETLFTNSLNASIIYAHIFQIEKTKIEYPKREKMKYDQEKEEKTMV